jgi:hypothetical protein
MIPVFRVETKTFFIFHEKRELSEIEQIFARSFVFGKVSKNFISFSRETRNFFAEIRNENFLYNLNEAI